MDVKKEAGGAGFLDPGIKIEEENPVGAKEGAVEEGGPRAKMAGRSCADTGHRVAQEPEENTSGNWDARLQAFVETLQAPPSVRAAPQLLDRKLCHEPGRSPGGPQGTGEAGRSPQRLWGSPKQPRLTGDVGQQPSPPLLGKDQGGALAGKPGWAEQRRQRFRTVRYQDARGPRDVCRQLRERCREWLEPEQRTKEQMVELVALEQFVAVLPPEMQSWVQEGVPATCAQAVTLAEAFLLRQAEAENRESQVPGLFEEHFASAPIPRAALPGPEKRQLPTENKHGCKGARSLLGSEGWLRENKERKPPVGSPAQRGRPIISKKTGQERDVLCHREAEGNPQKAEGPNGNVTATVADRPVPIQGVCEGLSRPAAQEEEKEEEEEEAENGVKDEVGREELRFNVSEDPETEPRLFRCWHCGQTFGSSVRLVTHEKTHVGEKFYTCLYCGRSERSHKGQKPHKCSRCGKTFNWSPQERLHEGETPYSCSDYGNSCSQRLDLLNHQRMHTGEDKRDEQDHKESAEGPREIKRELEEGAPQAEEPRKKQRLMVETRKMDPNPSNPGPKQKRRSYAAGFKLQVVSRAEETNNSIASREFCVDEKQVREWRKMKAELERIPAAKKARRGLTTSYGALETELCKWVMECRQNGYRVTRMGIRLRALQMAQDGQLKAPGIESFVASAGWCSRFMNRFALCWRQRTDISQKLPQGLDEKAMSFHSFIIKQRRLHNYDLGDIGNMDETPVAFDLPSDGTVASSGDKTTSLTTAGNKTNCFTVVLSCLANGTKLRPVVIFKRKSLPQAVQFPPRITVRAHDKGWLDEDGAKKWLEEIWNGRPGAGLRKKPSLLVWDEFGAHTSEDVTKLAKSSQVTLAVVPGGLVSVLQPLGAYLHKPFKDRVQKMWHEWMSSGQAPLTQVGNLMSPSVELIARWVQDAWEEIPEDMVQCAFKKCGISSATDGTEDGALCENDSSDGYDCELSGDDNIYADNLTSANAGALLGHTEEESSFEGV